MMAFYETGKPYIHSIAVLRDGEYRTQYDNETLDDLRAQGRDEMTLVPFDDACEKIDDVRMAMYCHAPVEETREQFLEMLGVLPPCKWVRTKGAEAFFVSEALSADIHAWHVRIGERYWTLNRSSACSAEYIIAEVANAMEAAT